MPGSPAVAGRKSSRTKLLEAVIDLVRRKGFSATRVEDVCTEAGVTKGSFFHHFASKDDLAIAAADLWRENAGTLFAEAEYNDEADPLGRLLGYLDFRANMLRGEIPHFTCFAGTVIQEAHMTHPELREACAKGMEENVAYLTPIIAAAMRKHGVSGDFTARSLAQYTQAVLQGAFILAKAEGKAKVATESVAHLRRYVEMLFGLKSSEKSK